ncbi:MAG: SDR family oxidoreductase [bacterium]|nr:SDR family oxidoreductase [bacterium]
MNKLGPTVQELFDMRGMVAVVTGAAHNLGFDMALALAEAGADVVITSRKLSSAKVSAHKISELTKRTVLPLKLDVRHETKVETMVDAVMERFGKIDILVNNAGNVYSTPDTVPFEKRQLKLWQEVISINLTGVFLCSKHVVAKSMKPKKTGVIINIGSTVGIIGKDRRVYQDTDMGGATLDYHAAKGGVISMTRDMAVYLAPFGIRVNCISPCGFFRNQPDAFVKAYSKTIPMGRMGKDGKEMKGAVVFLASEASSYCTGHNLVIDGGLTVW